MSTYIKNIKLKDLGPISEVLIEARFNDNGSPIPIVLVGQNGAGKSLTLSVILDAMTEARRASFREIQEVGATEYIRVSSKNYVRSSEKYSLAQVIFSDGNNTTIKFDEVVSRLPYSEFENLVPELLNLPNLVSGEFRTSGFHKNLDLTDLQKEAVRSLTFLYFPYFRYEPAYWMSGKANVDFASSQSYYGSSRINPIRTNIIEETKRWILNVLLDREVYEKLTTPVPGTTDGNPLQFWGYSGPNTQIFNMVNEILTIMLQAKDPDITFARVGIRPKGNRTIGVHVNKHGKEEVVVAPDLSQLSSRAISF